MRRNTRTNGAGNVAQCQRTQSTYLFKHGRGYPCTVEGIFSTLKYASKLRRQLVAQLAQSPEFSRWFQKPVYSKLERPYSHYWASPRMDDALSTGLAAAA